MKNHQATRVRALMGTMVLLATVVSTAHSHEPAPAGKLIRVFILSGQSNMVGAGKVDKIPCEPTS